MKIFEHVVKKVHTPKRRRIFDSTRLTGKSEMAESNRHPLAELLRNELVLRFLGRNLNASPTELLAICNSFLAEFKSYPDEVLEAAIKDMRGTSPDEIATTHIYNFLKQRIAKFFGCDNVDDLIWDAAVSRELNDGKKYHPLIVEIVAQLPDCKIKMIREQVCQLRDARTANVRTE